MRFHDFHSKTARKILVHQNEIITASWDATISVVDYFTLRQRLKLTHKGMGRSPYVAVSGSGEHFVTFSYDSDIKPEFLTNSIKIWSAKTGELEKEINNTGEHQTTIRSGACIVYGKLLYAISDSGYLSVFNFRSSRLVKRIFLKENLRSICIHASRKLLFVAGMSGNVYVCSLSPIELVDTIKCHSTDISTVRIHPGKEDMIITTSYDGTVKFWKLPYFNCEAVISCATSQLWTQAIRKDILFAGSDEGEIWIYDIGDLKNCKFKGKLTVYNDSFVVSPVDSNLFFTNDISNLEILDKETGKPITGKQAEYLLNASNSESVLQDVFKSEEELMEINNPSRKMMLQLPGNT
jgi:WD40 repeat protein